ncbi:putative Beta-lactamase family protein; 6-aminohexanoate-dimer hydrolase [Bradyrhizobium sp. ORS 285]|uniref:serine hydrolase domain-containing protein n=1 Tax=Bradyrhizobium sp. ORS 285 TaxID=115808 RepID=UPI0002407956|nr:serine hydrolase [Bradyrhizobium sp. ORS 285]CCD89053.1 putative Beta-lactamase family protein; 6-aminohexanoate-dimer hydrolase [Bradyrhizobium sp. ORS 285]SMX58285.1 putative Beta-lactamase family protein; 6-aminohexanoate-dimer hydrolase [Bradyrhizobium sp. ORS 285]
MPTDPSPATPDLSNWRTAPYSRWAFHNVRSILPVADIASAPGSAWPLQASPVSFEDFRLKLPKGGTLDLEGFLKATATDGLLILRDGRIVFEHYEGGNDRDTPHILMSATKSITGLMLGILAERGEIDIDAEVTRYVPEVAGTAYRGATIRQLTDMRAGIVFDAAGLQAYADAAGWEPVASGTTPNLHDFFATMRAQAQPHGGAFSYVSSNTDLLGWAIERATGRSFASLVGTLLWQPLGASGETFITVDRKGAPRCTGGFCTTLRDFARLGQLVLSGGRRGSHAIIPQGWLDDIRQNGDVQAWRDGQWRDSFAAISRNMHYRSGWYVINDEPQLMFAMGIHGQNLFVDAANRIVIAKLSSWAQPVDGQAIWLTHQAVAEFVRVLREQPAG